jgi:hypothetical protein
MVVADRGICCSGLESLELGMPKSGPYRCLAN